MKNKIASPMPNRATSHRSIRYPMTPQVILLVPFFAVHEQLKGKHDEDDDPDQKERTKVDNEVENDQEQDESQYSDYEIHAAPFFCIR